MKYYTMKEINEYFKQFKVKKMVLKSSKGIKYYNIPVTFDIETTNAYIDNLDGSIISAKDFALYKETHTTYDKSRYEKCAFMYCWQMSIDDKVMFGRTWKEYKEFLNKIKEVFNLSAIKQMVIYVRNLAFEFQFLKSHFLFNKVFANDSHKVIYACNEPFVYKCSYFLAGCSLDTTGKNLQKYKAEKQVGLLDYDLIRTSATPMTDDEIKYCVYDVIVDSNFIRESMESEKGGSILKLPLTKTGYVRRYCKKYCNEDWEYRKIIKRFTYSTDTFRQLVRCYTGAFTHANAVNVGKVFENVHSYDFTSSYPYCLLAYKYPMSSGRKHEIKNINDFKYCLKKYACVFDIKFYNIKMKDSVWDSCISKSKCIEISNCEENNGRVVNADYLKITINEIDFECIKQFYTFSRIEVSNLVVYYKDYLPKRFLECVIHFYKGKTELKDVKGKEKEYALLKAMLNSIYGMCVTNPVRENWDIDDSGEWYFDEPNIDDMLDAFNESKSRFIAYEWGIYCTSYARRNLFTGILEIGADYIYCDTDSLKFTNLENHLEYFENYNKEVEHNLREMCKARNIDFNDLKPKTKDGEEKMIGVWDYEGCYERFKTLGAKRYAYVKKGEFNITCSGLNKKTTTPYLLEQSKLQELDVFDLFSDSLYVPCLKTGKLVHTYCEDTFKGKVKDYLGNVSVVEESSYVHLEPSGYEMGLSEIFKNYINKVQTIYCKAY